MLFIIKVYNYYWLYILFCCVAGYWVNSYLKELDNACKDRTKHFSVHLPLLDKLELKSKYITQSNRLYPIIIITLFMDQIYY